MDSYVVGVIIVTVLIRLSVHSADRPLASSVTTSECAAISFAVDISSLLLALSSLVMLVQQYQRKTKLLIPQ